MKRLFRTSLAAAAALYISQAAHAQGSPAPIGLWQGKNSGDYILVQVNGSCSASGSIKVAGTCTWSATSTGGVLTMTYPWTLAPGHIGWSIRWINRNTLLINNVEQFVRRG